MTLRTRILLVYLLVVGGGVYYLVARSVEELRPRYLESMEESLVDGAHLLASAVGANAVENGRIDADKVRASVDGAFVRRFSATVYSITKTRVDLRVYVTDRGGRVVYDSDGGKAVGEDYSRWLDVSKTLRGEYGARATRLVPTNDDALVLYIAAPVLAADGQTVGVLSVGKPTASVNELVRAARKRLAMAGAIGGGLLVFLGVAFSIWIATPLARLTQYARAVRDGRTAKLPRLAGREVGELQVAFDEMRAALDGKAYVERYVQTLTHEIKSPLSAIRGAAEILAENRRRRRGKNSWEISARKRAGFSGLWISCCSWHRSKRGRRGRIFAEVGLSGLVREVVDAAQAGAQARSVMLAMRAETGDAGKVGTRELVVRGDRGLLGQAVAALVQNALEFTPAGGRVEVLLIEKDGGVAVRIEDSGTGIPDFALERVFERFYSLPRPGSGVKSTGLGLSLVREIAHLHEGEAAVANRADGVVGVRAELKMPVVDEGRSK